MKTYLCWHLPDGSPERGEEIQADGPDEAAVAFGETFFDESEGEWMGGQVVVQELDARLDGVGEAARYDVDVAMADLAVTARAL
jgi:hypothetical protein